jgi:signal transduction histidine kinase
VLDVRLIALSLTFIGFALAGRGTGWLALALLAAVFASYVPLRRWHLVGPTLVRHPLFLGADAAFAVVMLALTGSTSPFFYFTVGTAALAGILYGGRGAALFSALLVLGYWAVVAFEAGAPSPAVTGSFQTLVGMPALYPVTAAAGAALRKLLERQAAAAEALRRAGEAEAAAEERARLAREMHDSVTKTLFGIELSVAALADRIERDPVAGLEQARSLASAAGTASLQARELIACLRADRPDESLAETVRALTARWAETAAVPVRADIDAGVDLDRDARYELVCVLREALANVERHAAARRVTVRLRAVAGGVELEVRDEGRGFVPAEDLSGLQSAGHYGIVGMGERARRAGGRLQLHSRPGEGTSVRVTVPPPAGIAALDLAGGVAGGGAGAGR